MKKQLHDYLRANGNRISARCAKTMLALLITVLACMPASAAQIRGKVTIDVRQATVAEVFSIIGNQSDNKLTFNNEQLEALPRVDISVEEADITDVIDQCLKGSALEWTLIGDTYVIRMGRQEEPSPTRRVSLSGRVTVAGSTDPIVHAMVLIPQLNLWAATDVNGTFRIPSAPTGSYTIEVSCLGFQARSFDVTITRNTDNLAFQLEKMTLRLDEVTVMAKTGTGFNSSSTVDRTAIDHLQATSISDVMQLMPGALTTNPSLISANGNRLAIRETTASDLSSFSVGLIVDGAPISNDASLSKNTSLTRSAETDTDKTRSLDMRTISTDNMESVEIIRGVVSAEYGDMISGGVIITTKAGRSPLEIRMKTDPQTKAFALSKGFGLGGNAGFINVDADYAKAFTDIRTSKDAYDRITSSIGYSNTLMKSRNPLNFNAKLNVFVSNENGNPDKDDMKEGFVRKGYENGVGLNLYGTWLLKKKWITDVKYSFSGRYTDQFSRDASINIVSSYASTNAEEPGENAGKFLPAQYYSDTRYSSRPVYGNAKISASLAGSYGKIINKFLLGGEFNTLGNVGDGRYYRGDFIPAGYRPRAFKDIPFMNKTAAFAENKVSIPFGKTTLELQAGVRLTNTAVEGYDNNFTVEPRLNGRYVLVNGRKGNMRHLSVRGGWGKTSRSLTLDAMFPGDTYTDVQLVSWSGNERNLSVMHTFKATEQMRQNKNLKNPESTKIEIGTDFDLFGVKGSIVYFKEQERNSLMTFSEYVPVSFTRYYNPDINNKEKYNPVYENGELKNTAEGGAAFEAYEDVTFLEIMRAGNLTRKDKWGLEFTLDFGRIEPLRTSIILDGAYFNIERRNADGEMADYRGGTSVMNNHISSYGYVGIYIGDYSMTNGAINKRFNTNVNFVTHIPKLRLITSVTIQAVWMEKNQWRNDGNVYIVNDEGERVYGNFYKGAPSTIYKDPARYMDTDGNIHDFTAQSVADNPALGKLVNSFSNYMVNQYREDSFKPYFMANLRITKEIGDFASVSFYSQNFTNSRPMRYRVSINSYDRKNTAIYFGAELRLRF